MANKLSAAVKSLETALQALVVSGALKAVERTILNPLTVAQPPRLGLKIVRYGRQTGNLWQAELYLTLITKAGMIADDEANIDLATAVDDVILAWSESANPGCVADQPTWEPWEWRQKVDGPLMPVGNIGGLVIRIQGPLAL